MLGTTAATIVNHIDRPVIVVRPAPIVADATDPARAGSILRRDHERLEKIYGDLLAAYRSGDWETVRTQWAVFEPAISTHMETEEHDVFPDLRAINPEEADALLAEHAELRRILGTLGVAIDLHAVPGGDAQELVARLRAHGAREEAVLYAWMDEALDTKKLHRLSPPT
jgi:hemerythrin-like domain-containing protein